MIPLTQWFVSSSVLILVILLLRAALSKKLSLCLRYALWAVVLVRLLLPFSPITSFLTLSAISQPIQERAESQMLYALPTRTYYGSFQEDNIPRYDRTEITQYATINGESHELATYLSGGSVTYQDHRTDYFFLMPADEVMALIWKVGMVVCAICIIRSNLAFSRSLKKKRVLYPDVDSPVPVYLVSDGLPTPCLFGLFRPAVYLTPEAAADEDTLHHVLAHELTHYTHKDHIWSHLRCVCLVLHWYNPLVWLACILSKRDGELACDEGAVKRLGEEERLSYGRTLLGMVARRSQRPADLLTSSTAMAEGKKPIQQRIQLLVKRPETTSGALLLTVCAIALSVFLVFSVQSNPSQLEFTTYEQVLGEFDLTQPWHIMDGNQWTETTDNLPIAVHAELKQLLSNATPEHRWVSRTNYDQNSGSILFSLIPTQLVLYETENGCHLVEGLYFEGDNPDSYLHYYQIKYQYFHLATLPSGTVKAIQNLLDSTAPTVFTPLTQEELDFFNTGDFFDHGERTNGEGRMNIRNQFLSSFYENPKDVDLFDLFYCGTGESSRSIAQTQQIMSDIIASVPYYPDCGCTTITTDEINAVLTKHLGLSLEETNKVGLDEFDYLAAHDTYFHFHGDTNYGQMVHFTSGQRLGNTIQLYYQDNFGLLGFIPCVLTLRQEGDHYYFFSNQPVYNDPAIALSVPNTGDPDADAQTFADELRTRYIFLNEHHPRAVHNAKFYRLEKLSHSDTQLCFRLSLAIDPIEVNNWYTQRGIIPIKTEPHAGLYDFTMDYRLELQPDNTWLCTKSANGGLSAS